MPAGTAKKPNRPPSKAPGRPWLDGSLSRHILAIAALCLLALAAYSNCFQGALVADNGALVAGDVRVHAVTSRNLGLIFGQHYWFGNGESNLYRPLTTLSFLFNYAILGNGASPAGYHAINLALHAVNIALVYLLAFWIFHEIAAAGLMAALWAVHPVLTESITNIVGRADLLAGLAVLGGLVCHVLAARSKGRRRMLWRAGLFAVVAAGIFSKENTIVVLGVLPLWDFLMEPRRDWRPRLANYGAAAAPCLAFLCVRGLILAKSLAYFVPYTDNPLASADFWTARLTAIKVIGKYLTLLVWPVSLSSDYSYNEIPLFTGRFASFEDWKIPIVLLACVALVGIAWRYRRRNPKLSFFIALFFVTLAPTANLAIVVGTPMAERFLYLPTLAMAGCMVTAITFLARQQTARAILAAVILLFAARTWTRNTDWESDKTLMLSDAESAPGSFKPHMALVALAGDPQRAIAEAGRAHQILDGLPDGRNSMQAYTNFGICYRQEGDRLAANGAAAREWYQKSLRDLLRARSIEQAFDARLQRENLSRVKGTTNFGWFPVYMELGRTYLRLSQPEDALAALRHGLLLEFRPEFFEEISHAYEEEGDSRQAAIALMEGLAMNSGQSQLAAGLADIYRKSAPRSCAVQPGGGVNMQCPLVKDELCSALANVAELYSTVGRHADAAQAENARKGEIGCHP